MKRTNILRYRGYTTTIYYQADDAVLCGKIEGINDLVCFHSESACEIVKEFHNAVDEYLAICKHQGKEPNKPYSGTFNVRISPELHRQLSVKAKEDNRSLNFEVELAIEQYINKGGEQE